MVPAAVQGLNCSQLLANQPSSTKPLYLIFSFLPLDTRLLADCRQSSLTCGGQCWRSCMSTMWRALACTRCWCCWMQPWRTWSLLPASRSPPTWLAPFCRPSLWPCSASCWMVGPTGVLCGAMATTTCAALCCAVSAVLCNGFFQLRYALLCCEMPSTSCVGLCCDVRKHAWVKLSVCKLLYGASICQYWQACYSWTVPSYLNLYGNDLQHF